MAKMFTRLFKKPFFARYQRPFVWPESVPREPWTRVEFSNGTGGRLIGTHARARAYPPRGIAVVPHPMVAEAKAWCLTSGHADLLRDAGFDVLAFDFNGFGESEDTGFDFPNDVRSAGLHAATLLPGKPVVIFGLSMGAAYGMCALDFDDNPFRVAVFEATFTTLREFWRHFPLPHLVLRVSEPLMPRATVRMVSPIERAHAARGIERVLFIHGAKDRFTPPEMGDRISSRKLSYPRGWCAAEWVPSGRSRLSGEPGHRSVSLGEHRREPCRHSDRRLGVDGQLPQLARSDSISTRDCRSGFECTAKQRRASVLKADGGASVESAAFDCRYGPVRKLAAGLLRIGDVGDGFEELPQKGGGPVWSSSETRGGNSALANSSRIDALR